MDCHCCCCQFFSLFFLFRSPFLLPTWIYACNLATKINFVDSFDYCCRAYFFTQSLYAICSFSLLTTLNCFNWRRLVLSTDFANSCTISQHRDLVGFDTTILINRNYCRFASDSIFHFVISFDFCAVFSQYFFKILQNPSIFFKFCSIFFRLPQTEHAIWNSKSMFSYLFIDLMMVEVQWHIENQFKLSGLHYAEKNMLGFQFRNGTGIVSHNTPHTYQSHPYCCYVFVWLNM